MTAITVTSLLSPAGREPTRDGDVLPSHAGAMTGPLIVFIAEAPEGGRCTGYRRIG